MSPESPWFRFFFGLVVAAVAIRVVIDLLVPVAPFLLAAVLLAGCLWVARWWRDRW